MGRPDDHHSLGILRGGWAPEWPEVDARARLYRSPNLTSVYVQSSYGMDNYAVLGLK